MLPYYFSVDSKSIRIDVDTCTIPEMGQQPAHRSLRWIKIAAKLKWSLVARVFFSGDSTISGPPMISGLHRQTKVLGDEGWLHKKWYLVGFLPAKIPWKLVVCWIPHYFLGIDEHLALVDITTVNQLDGVLTFIYSLLMGIYTHQLKKKAGWRRLTMCKGPRAAGDKAKSWNINPTRSSFSPLFSPALC